MSSKYNEVTVLKLTLHERLVGYLIGYKNGRNVLSFVDEFKRDTNRPTFSLITHPNFPRAEKIMNESWIRNQKIHPVLSNLLPEGSMRAFISQSLKVHTENEFPIFFFLGQDLPGALIAKAIHPDEIPSDILAIHDKPKILNFNNNKFINKFSLSGVQMKFSMKEKAGRYSISHGNNVLGDWIIKTPSIRHRYVPENEFSAMTLASLAGINIPEIKLVELSKLNNLPDINLPNEKLEFNLSKSIYAKTFACL